MCEGEPGVAEHTPLDSDVPITQMTAKSWHTVHSHNDVDGGYGNDDITSKGLLFNWGRDHRGS